MKEKREAGRPVKWKPEYNKMMEDYFLNAPYFEYSTKPVVTREWGVIDVEEKVACPCPTFIHFAIEIGVGQDTLIDWCKNPKCEGFSQSYKKCMKIQEQWLLNAGGMGFFKDSMAIMALKANHHWSDRVESTSTQQVEVKKVYVTKEDLKEIDNHIDEVISNGN